jgi:Ran GTPase-activating protein (RanGAP) involved in mRNA processing and transport
MTSAEENTTMITNSKQLDVTCQSCVNLKQTLQSKDNIIKELETQLLNLKSQYDFLSNQYENFNSHMDSIVENIQFNNFVQYESGQIQHDEDTNFHEIKPYIKQNELNGQSINPNNFYSNSSAKHAFKQESFIIDLISENLFIDYKLSTSLNLNALNKKILKNNKSMLLPYLTTSFQKEPNSHITLSPINDYLQYIILTIYITFRKHKYESLLGLNKEHHLQNENYSWIISDEDINEEVINLVVDEVLTNYMLEWHSNHHHLVDSQISKNFNNLNSLEYLFDFHYKHFLQNLQAFNLREGIKGKFHTLISNEIKKHIASKFNEKVSDYHSVIRKDINMIVKSIKNFIHAGKVFYKNIIIYDFFKLYVDLGSFTENSTGIYYYQSLENPSNSDYLINRIKYCNNSILKLTISGEISKTSSKNGTTSYLEPDRDNKDSSCKSPISLIISCIITNSDLLLGLQSLSLTHFGFDGASLSSVCKFLEFSSTLCDLDLSNNKFADRGTRLICESLKYNKSIKTLHLSYNNISSNGSFYIAEMLLKNKDITNLFLGGNSLKDLGLQSLINILTQNNKTLKLLDISNNNFSQNDLIIISNLIMKNCQNIQILNVSKQKFDLDSLNTFGLALKINTNLKTLYLNEIGLDEDTSPYFIQHLIETNLEEIHLNDNNLNEVGGVLIANVIKCNAKLKNISLKDTNINSISLTCISHALESPKSVCESLYLNDNYFEDDGIEALINSLQNIIGNSKKLAPKIYMTKDCVSEKITKKLINCKRPSQNSEQEDFNFIQLSDY